MNRQLLMPTVQKWEALIKDACNADLRHRSRQAVEAADDLLVDTDGDVTCRPEEE